MEELINIISEDCMQAVLSTPDGELQTLNVPKHKWGTFDHIYCFQGLCSDKSASGDYRIIYDPFSEDEINYDACLLLGLDTCDEDCSELIRGDVIIVGLWKVRGLDGKEHIFTGNVTVGDIEDELAHLEKSDEDETYTPLD